MKYSIVLAEVPLALLVFALLALPFVQTELAYATNSSPPTNSPTSYAIAFNSIPSSGSIVFNGTACLSGSTMQAAAGNYPINAIITGNFVFSNWTASANISIANVVAQNTIASISGNGIITASFNAIT
ncbi:MAG: hypothetical protein ACP5K5_03550, partial [Candidatus Micrarchaeia archaeon]